MTARSSIPMPLPIPSEAIGQSPAFLDLQERLRRVAPIERPVLLLGERGTGKEMAARRLHFLSKRWQHPFVTLNCAALSPTLIESELFGHEAGAFTGAIRRRQGRFETAHHGTLFLDEISLIPVETQEKILRVVEYGVFERVGSTTSVEADARIIGATNADLVREAEHGRFKRDLLDRLSFEVVFLPPLRERREDILFLAHHFAGKMAVELGRGEVPRFSETAQDALLQYAWPGNIRELKNVVERAVYRAEGALVETLDFDPFHQGFEAEYAPLRRESTALAERTLAADPLSPEALEAALEETLSREGKIRLSEIEVRLETAALEKALAASRYNQRLAAEKLGLTYHQFRRLYRKRLAGHT